MIDIALDLAFLIALAAVAAGLGHALARRLDPGGVPTGDTRALALPLGLGLLGLAVLALGLAGSLNRAAMAAVAVAAAVVAAIEARRARPWRRSAVWTADAPDRLARGIVLAIAGATLVAALPPPTDGDALCYHLLVPRRFLEAGRLTFDPDLHETVYPLLVEVLFVPALAARGPVACRLVAWLCGVGLAGVVAALARPWLGRRAGWAAAAALGVPAVTAGLPAPLNDVALAAWSNAALLGVLAWWRRPGAGPAALAGVLAGMALGVKFPALVWVALSCFAVLIIIITKDLRSRICRNRDVQMSPPGDMIERRRAEMPGYRISHFFILSIVALLVAAPWYLRAAVHTGNPVHPFFRHVFGGAGLDEVLEPAWRPLPPTPGNLATALAPMTLDPARFDSLAHQFGPLFLMALPALLVLRPPRGVVLLVGFGLAFLALCLTQRQSTRFVLAAVGPWSVGAAWVLVALARRRDLPARLAAGLLALVLVGQAGLAVARTRPSLPYVLGRETAAGSLARREPTAVVGRWVDAHLPPTARLIGQDHRGFYIPRPYTMELAHRRRTGLASRGESPDQVVDALRRRGFTHLMLCPPRPEDAVEFDPTLSRRLAPWLAARRPLYRADLADADGVVRAYAIYDLADGRDGSSGREAAR